MLRLLLLSAAALAAAGSAEAGDVRVSLVGKDAAAIHADIRKAARQACWDEIAGSFVLYPMLGECIAKAVADAEARLPAAMAQAQAAPSAPPSGQTVASNAR